MKIVNERFRKKKLKLNIRKKNYALLPSYKFFVIFRLLTVQIISN